MEEDYHRNIWHTVYDKAVINLKDDTYIDYNLNKREPNYSIEITLRTKKHTWSPPEQYIIINERYYVQAQKTYSRILHASTHKKSREFLFSWIFGELLLGTSASGITPELEYLSEALELMDPTKNFWKYSGTNHGQRTNKKAKN